MERKCGSLKYANNATMLNGQFGGQHCSFYGRIFMTNWGIQ